MLDMDLQTFADETTLEGGGETQTVTIGEQEYTLDELAEVLKNNKRLERKITELGQKNGELESTVERAQEWLKFDDFLKTQPANVVQEFSKNVDDFFTAVQQGTVTQRSITGIDKAINAADKAGDTKTADALRDERDEALAELLVDKEILSLAKEAKKDGIEFDEDEFKAYLAKYLEDEGLLDDNDEWDTKEIKRAYKAYKLDQKEKALSKPPAVGTGGSGVSAGKGKSDKGPKNLKEAFNRYMGINT